MTDASCSTNFSSVLMPSNCGTQSIAAHHKCQHATLDHLQRKCQCQTERSQANVATNQHVDTAAGLLNPNNTAKAFEQAELQAQTDTTRSCATTAEYSIPVRHKDQLSYQQFVQDFMQPNLPVMIQGLACDWRSTRDWVKDDGTINIGFFSEHFGQAEVIVSDTTRSNAACAPRLNMTVQEFAHWWQMHKAGQDDRLLYLKDWHFANEFPLYEAYQTPCYFQEDWLNEFHDMKQKGLQPQKSSARRASAAEDATAETTGSALEQHLHTTDVPDEICNRLHVNSKQPKACQSSMPGVEPGHQHDALSANMHEAEKAGQQADEDESSRAALPGDRASCDVVSSDYRFVYLGCKGTWTRLHADVLRSYSWSTNVTGRKRWKLLPPEHTHLLYDRFGREVAASFDITQVEGRDSYPNLDQACQHVLECVQEPGETIFVPSGWHHTVHNLEDTLSINHNWLNGYNIHWAWALLHQEHAEATACIADCRDGCSAEEFEALVQRNMAANCGMDYAFMADFMHAILHRATKALRHSADIMDDSLCHSFDELKAARVLKELQQQQCMSLTPKTTRHET